MAIKGKKKPQSRGSAARRRPATPPRLAYVKQVHVPWYRTAGGRVAAAITVVLVVAGAASAITAYTSSNNRAEARQDRINSYTSSVRTLLGEVAEPASAMAAVPANPDDRTLKALPEQAAEWGKALTSAEKNAQNLNPPEGLQGASTVFLDSIRLYSMSATTYKVAAGAEGEVQRQILERAKEQTEVATSLWTDAVFLLDEQRNEAGLNPSQILSPPLASASQL
jgi:hypothetical protein